MNLDELKGAWTAYDDRLKSTKEIEDQVIAGMIRKRSVSTVSAIRKSYRYGMWFCGFYILAIGGINIGNPFDYTQDIEYYSAYIIFGSLILMMAILLLGYHTLKKTELPAASLSSYLEEVIKKYRKTHRLLKWAIYMMLFSASVLFPLSFLPRKIASSGLWPGLLETFSLLIIILIANVITHFLAKKKGVGEESWYSFKVIIKELEELKIMAAELKNS